MIGYSVVNTKGQVTIPSSMRKSVGIKPQDKVVVTKEDRRIIIETVPDIFSLMGSVKPRTKPENFKKMRQEFINYLGNRKRR